MKVFFMNKFIRWLVKPLSQQDINKYIESNDINLQKTELFLDIFMSLHKIIEDTYLGTHGTGYDGIDYSEEDNENHFEWCWNKLLFNFEQEGVYITKEGSHKEYLKLFFYDSFYNQKESGIRESIEFFFNAIFNIDNMQTSADLEILNEMYKMMVENVDFDKKISHVI